MAYAVLPDPGTDLGPCEPECAHIDCNETRRMAEYVCAFCGKPIGYGRALVSEGDGFAHLGCAEEAGS